MKTFKSPFFWLSIIFLVIIGYLLYTQNYSKNNNVAVYLSTGELYFGKKVSLLGFKLQSAWLLNKDQEGKYSLQEFSQAAWKPIGLLNISRDKVVFWTEINSTSDISKLISGEKKSSDIQSSSQDSNSNSIPEPTPSTNKTK